MRYELVVTPKDDGVDTTNLVQDLKRWLSRKGYTCSLKELNDSPSHQVSVYLPKATREKLDAYVNSYGLTTSWGLRRAAERWMQMAKEGTPVFGTIQTTGDDKGKTARGTIPAKEWDSFKRQLEAYGVSTNRALAGAIEVLFKERFGGPGTVQTSIAFDETGAPI